MSLKKKLLQKDPNNLQSILDVETNGPSFGYDDIRVKDADKGTSMRGIRNSYLGPNGEADRSWASYLGGSNYFKVTEIEVYKVE